MVPYFWGYSFPGVAEELRVALLDAPHVKTERWQGVPVNTDTRELRNACFEVDLGGNEDLDHWRASICPSIPWADDHFLERVGGEPLNPGIQWQHWPWGNSANKFRAAAGAGPARFNHTYMERLWPKFCRRTPDGSLPKTFDGIRRYPENDFRQKQGIGHSYGDLQDFVELLAEEPHTRQAWIPLFFPEDTGKGDGGRKPCTLGYQIMVRDGWAHIWYPLRSCDFRRHWRDDCYLAVRLLLWTIDRCRERSEKWRDILPGTYSMHCTSLHVFESDMGWLRGESNE
jgi:hypothetical protein